MESSGSTTSGEVKVKVACIQMQPAIGKVEANLAHGIGLINRAAELGANLIVLPELSNTGYMFQSREEAFALSEPIPNGPTVRAWSEIAAKHKLHLVAGICERDGVMDRVDGLVAAATAVGLASFAINVHSPAHALLLGS